MRRPQLDPDVLDDHPKPLQPEHELLGAIIDQAIRDARGRNIRTSSPEARYAVQADAVAWLRTGHELNDFADMLGFDQTWFRQQCLIQAGLSTEAPRLGLRTSPRTPKGLRLRSPELLSDTSRVTNVHLQRRDSFQTPVQRRSPPFMLAYVARAHVAEVRWLRTQGFSQAAIAERLGIAKNTVRRCLKMADSIHKELQHDRDLCDVPSAFPTRQT